MEKPEGQPEEKEREKLKKRKNSPRRSGDDPTEPKKHVGLDKQVKSLQDIVKAMVGIVIATVAAVVAVRACRDKQDIKIKIGEVEISTEAEKIMIAPSTDPMDIYPKGTPENERQPKLDREYPAALKAIYSANPDTDTKDSERIATDVLGDLGDPQKYRDAARSWCLKAEASKLLGKALLVELNMKYGSGVGVIAPASQQFQEVNSVLKRGIAAADQIKDYWPAAELEIRSAELWQLGGDLNQSEVEIRQAQSYARRLTADSLFIWFRSFVPPQRSGAPGSVSFVFNGQPVSITAKPDDVLHIAAEAELKVVRADVEGATAEQLFKKIGVTSDRQEISSLTQKFLSSVGAAIAGYGSEMRGLAHVLALRAGFLSDRPSSTLTDLIQAGDDSNKAISCLNRVASQMGESSGHSATFELSWSEECFALMPGLRAKLRLARGAYVGAKQNDLTSAQRKAFIQEALDGADVLLESRDKSASPLTIKSLQEIKLLAKATQQTSG
ncbi:MAG TPA: hypothetical protein VGL56_20920 [Fimbriimonadaceae bacterium]|jgi:hypothetical protein